MSFQIGIQRAQAKELFLIKQSRFRPCGVEQRSGMAFREHEAIVGRMLWILRIIPHDGKEQRRHNIGGRRAARRMPASGLAGGPNAVDSQFSGFVVKYGEEGILCHSDSHDDLLYAVVFSTL